MSAIGLARLISGNMGFWLEKMNLIGLDFICFFDIKAGKRYLFHEKIAGKTPNFQGKKLENGPQK